MSISGSPLFSEVVEIVVRGQKSMREASDI